MLIKNTFLFTQQDNLTYFNVQHVLGYKHTERQAAVVAARSHWNTL